MLEKSLREIIHNREERGAGLFETIVREAGGRQMIKK